MHGNRHKKGWVQRNRNNKGGFSIKGMTVDGFRVICKKNEGCSIKGTTKEECTVIGTKRMGAA